MSERDNRFKFGNNWAKFLENLDDIKINHALTDIKEKLALDNLEGKSFLDIGSGSGLHSLCAQMLGATKIHSFDFDSDCVNCTLELKSRYFPNQESWTIEQASVLNEEYMRSLGNFDIVYSWGVLHHTGEMYKALEIAASVLEPNGILFISIYNDQGDFSKLWHFIKKVYVHSPGLIKFLMCFTISFLYEIMVMISKLVKLQNPLPFKEWQEYYKHRGMSYWTNVIDWVGGYPFEVASPQAIFDFYHEKGFSLQKLETTNGHGCNVFVFHKQ